MFYILHIEFWLLIPPNLIILFFTNYFYKKNQEGKEEEKDTGFPVILRSAEKPVRNKNILFFFFNPSGNVIKCRDNIKGKDC